MSYSNFLVYNKLGMVVLKIELKIILINGDIYSSRHQEIFRRENVMHYCRNFNDGINIKYQLPFTDKVEFGYTNSDKEYYEPIKIYLKQIKELKRQYSPGYLDSNKEIELFERIEKGDEEAKDIIFIKFLAYVPRIIKYYVGNGVAIEDLIQEGNLALLEAIKSFDYRIGYRFSTYAKLVIRKRIRLCIPFYLTSYDIPVQSVSILRKLNKLFEEASMGKSEEISIHTICDIGTNSRKELNLYYIMNSMSINELENEELEYIQDIEEISFEDEVIIKQLIINIKNIMGEYLTDREENIIRLLYGLDDERERTYKEVSRIFNISSQSIKNNELKAIEKIIKHLI